VILKDWEHGEIFFGLQMGATEKLGKIFVLRGQNWQLPRLEMGRKEMWDTPPHLKTQT